MHPPRPILYQYDSKISSKISSRSKASRRMNSSKFIFFIIMTLYFMPFTKIRQVYFLNDLVSKRQIKVHYLCGNESNKSYVVSLNQKLTSCFKNGTMWQHSMWPHETSGAFQFDRPIFQSNGVHIIELPTVRHPSNYEFKHNSNSSYSFK